MNMRARPGRIMTSALLAAALLAGCTGAMAESSWLAEHDRDHPRVGDWLNARGEAVPIDAPAPARVQDAKVVLLGEVHGHPDHHRRQLQVIEWLSAEGRAPTLAFEIFDRDDREAIEAFRAEGEQDADLLAERLQISERGWPWDAYRPLVQYALDHDLPILPLNLSRRDAQAIMRGGMAALPENELLETAMKGAPPFSSSVTDAWAEDVIKAHCGHIGQDTARAMVSAQQVRDAVMATNLATADQLPVVVMTGAEHARRDRGIAHWLPQLRPDWQLVSIGMRPVLPERQAVDDYREVAARYDWTWLTPRQYAEDPCERMKKQLERLKQAD
ncbi:MAG: ChaN family lipoprotein [Halothiobacillaceae bacterium]